jgi:hypothetical protein
VADLTRKASEADLVELSKMDLLLLENEPHADLGVIESSKT